MVHPIWATFVRRVTSSTILKIDLQDYMTSSHMHHIKLQYPIMSQSCVYKWHTQHVVCDELQSTHTQKGLLHLSYIIRIGLDYNTSHNTCGINEFPPLYIENGYKWYNYNDACGITLDFLSWWWFLIWNRNVNLQNVYCGIFGKTLH